MRKRSGVILVVIGYIVFFFCMEGWGADWEFILKDAQDNVWEIDTASISRQPNNIMKVWLKITYSKEAVNRRIKEYGEKKYKDLSYVQVLEEYNCTEKKQRSLTSTYYSSGRKVIRSFQSPGKWSSIDPESTGEAVFKEVCKESR